MVTVQRKGDCGALSPEWDLITSPPPKAQTSLPKSDNNIVRARGGRRLW